MGVGRVVGRRGVRRRSCNGAFVVLVSVRV